MDLNKTGIIVQARFSASRLPGKLFLPFYKNKSIIEIVLDKFKTKINDDIPIILATTENPLDDKFINLAKSFNIKLFRGSEDDVLKRTIDAAEESQLNTIVRVCADNPLFDVETTLKLLDFHYGVDYTAYELEGGLPSIKSHLGFWGEVVSINALKKVVDLTKEKFFHEHVTNYVYGNPDLFKINLLKAPSIAYKRKEIRLTVDTQEDFSMLQDIYSKLSENYGNHEVEKVIDFLDRNEHYFQLMKRQIIRNKK